MTINEKEIGQKLLDLTKNPNDPSLLYDLERIAQQLYNPELAVPDIEALIKQCNITLSFENEMTYVPPFFCIGNYLTDKSGSDIYISSRVSKGTRRYAEAYLLAFHFMAMTGEIEDDIFELYSGHFLPKNKVEFVAEVFARMLLMPCEVLIARINEFLRICIDKKDIASEGNLISHLSERFLLNVEVSHVSKRLLTLSSTHSLEFLDNELVAFFMT